MSEALADRPSLRLKLLMTLHLCGLPALIATSVQFMAGESSQILASFLFIYSIERASKDCTVGDCTSFREVGGLDAGPPLDIADYPLFVVSKLAVTVV